MLPLIDKGFLLGKLDCGLINSFINSLTVFYLMIFKICLIYILFENLNIFIRAETDQLLIRKLRLV